jgi:hypothetical protein
MRIVFFVKATPIRAFATGLSLSRLALLQMHVMFGRPAGWAVEPGQALALSQPGVELERPGEGQAPNVAPGYPGSSPVSVLVRSVVRGLLVGVCFKARPEADHRGVTHGSAVCDGQGTYFLGTRSCRWDQASGTALVEVTYPPLRRPGRLRAVGRFAR